MSGTEQDGRMSDRYKVRREQQGRKATRGAESRQSLPNTTCPRPIRPRRAAHGMQRSPLMLRGVTIGRAPRSCGTIRTPRPIQPLSLTRLSPMPTARHIKPCGERGTLRTWRTRPNSIFGTIQTVYTSHPSPTHRQQRGTCSSTVWGCSSDGARTTCLLC